MKIFDKKFAGALGTAILAASLTTLVTGCGGNDEEDVNPALEPYVISMRSGSIYSKPSMTLPLGQTATWINEDSVPHSVTSDPLNPIDGGPNSDIEFPNGIPPGSSYSWSFPSTTVQGTTWYYHCRYHGTPGNGRSLGSGMVGVVYAF